MCPHPRRHRRPVTLKPLGLPQAGRGAQHREWAMRGRPSSSGESLQILHLLKPYPQVPPSAPTPLPGVALGGGHGFPPTGASERHAQLRPVAHWTLGPSSTPSAQKEDLAL